ncbi:MAG: CinA family protein [Hyphomicrobiaceae bacterium]
MFPPVISRKAVQVCGLLQHHNLKLATAESCTGGLVAAAVTSVAGASEIFERGFVTYSIPSKAAVLGVPVSLIEAHGAVSRDVAVEMARGACRNPLVDIAVSVTGLAGPGGGSPLKPVGLVFIAVAGKGGMAVVREYRFGAVGRDSVRLASVEAALDLIVQTVGEMGTNPL